MKEHPFTEKIITQFFEGTLPELQHTEVLNWFSSLPEEEKLEFMDRHISLLEPAEVNQSAVQPAGFREIESLILSNSRSRLKTGIWIMRIAASLLPLLLVYFFVQHPSATKGALPVKTAAAAAIRMIHNSNTLNTVSSIQLPDSSTVSLYPGATLTYPEGLNGKKREIQLSGKAFFKIKHISDRPFSVHTGVITTVVLGTSFWVDAPKDSRNISIKVKTGKVGVLQANHHALFLLPSEKAVFNGMSGVLAKVKQHPVQNFGSKPVSPVLTALVFNQTPLKQVALILAENFKVQIILQGSIDTTLPVSLSTKDKTIAEVLQEIKSQIPIDYEIKDRHINIRKQE